MRAVSVAIDSLRQGDRAGELTRRGLAHLCCQFDRVAANSGLELLTAHFGMHRFLKEADASTEVKVVTPGEDPLDGVARVYFEVVRVLKSLDANRDRVISSWEIVTATSPLRGLDRNGDQVLDAEECGLPKYQGQDPSMEARVRLEFMKVNPVLKALDADGDGLMSFAEINGASVALRRLDKNGDGGLSPAEVIPERIDRRDAMLLSKLDQDGDRRLSRQEWPEEEASSQRSLLSQADRDGDGIVTEAERTRELTLRDEVRSIERRATGLAGEVRQSVRPGR